MLCDLLGAPLEVLEATETGALGSAICAAAAAGRYEGLPQAAGAMNRLRAVYQPDPGRTAVYRRKYQAYRRAVRAMEVFEDHDAC